MIVLTGKLTFFVDERIKSVNSKGLFYLLQCEKRFWFGCGSKHAGQIKKYFRINDGNGEKHKHSEVDLEDEFWF